MLSCSMNCLVDAVLWGKTCSCSSRIALLGSLDEFLTVRLEGFLVLTALHQLYLQHSSWGHMQPSGL